MLPSENNDFVPPSDRQLALRGRLKTGWKSRKSSILSPQEQELIVSVIKRNEVLEEAERKRVGKLVDKLNNIKERTGDYGPKNCNFCGQIFRFLRTKIICDDCRKPVCSKCAIELNVKQKSGNLTLMVLCKICSETREMWKKTGAWFYKGIPAYDLPQTNSSAERRTSALVRKSMANIRLNDESSSSDEDDDILRRRRMGQFTSHSQYIDFGSAESQQSSQAETQSAKAPGSYSMSDTSSLYSSTIIRHCSNESIKEPPVGWLEVILNFSQKEQMLECTVLRARDLPAMDALGLTDPFCKLNIVSLDGVCRHISWSRSKTVHKTRNPEFNETIVFPGVGLDEVMNSILFIVLLDDDKYGHDFLGCARMNLSVMFDKNFYRISIPLDVEDNVSSRAVSEGPWPRGQILLALSYNTKKRSLQVLIKECKNLLSMDHNGFSDPFVKIQLKPDNHRKKFKTNIKWRNLNPIFNQEFSFETRPNDLDKQSLVITVWDKDLGKSNDFLGSLVLSGGSKGTRLKQWKSCIRLPDHYHEFWHCLSSEQPH